MGRKGPGSLHSELRDVAILLRDPSSLSHLVLYSAASRKNRSEHGTSVMPGSPESKPTGEMEHTPFPTEGNASACTSLALHIGIGPCWHYHRGKGFAFFGGAMRVDMARRDK